MWLGEFVSGMIVSAATVSGGANGSMESTMRANAALYALAALAEIGGCFAVWAVLRRGATPWLYLVAAASLALFAWLLTRSEAAFAGRAYAAYGGVYIAASLLWLWAVEGQPPSRIDLLGGAISLVGAGLILSQVRP
jgi:small multidrug resistance family-3 protein